MPKDERTCNEYSTKNYNNKIIIVFLVFRPYQTISGFSRLKKNRFSKTL